MAYGLLSVWVREPNDCSVVKENGEVVARGCCGDEWHKAKLKEGHAQFNVPPGCYIVDASLEPGCCGYPVKETMVIVKCNETVCVNLLREYAGDPIRSIIPFAIHGREAGIPDEEIEKLVGILEKIAETVPKGKVKRYTERELALIEKVSDKAHKEVLDKYRSRLLGK